MNGNLFNSFASLFQPNAPKWRYARRQPSPHQLQPRRPQGHGIEEIFELDLRDGKGRVRIDPVFTRIDPLGPGPLPTFYFEGTAMVTLSRSKSRSIGFFAGAL